MRSRCVGCAVEPADAAGPVHRYLESSPARRSAQGAALGCEYSHPACGAARHSTVDAYAAQHAGRRPPQAIRSVAVRLIRLGLILEGGTSTDAAVAAMRAAASRTGADHRLAPPTDRGARTFTAVRAWASDAWRARGERHRQSRAGPPAGTRRDRRRGGGA